MEERTCQVLTTANAFSCPPLKHLRQPIRGTPWLPCRGSPPGPHTLSAAKARRPLSAMMLSAGRRHLEGQVPAESPPPCAKPRPTLLSPPLASSPAPRPRHQHSASHAGPGPASPRQVNSTCRSGWPMPGAGSFPLCGTLVYWLGSQTRRPHHFTLRSTFWSGQLIANAL